MSVDRDALRRVREQAREWRRRLELPSDAREVARDTDHAGLLLALAYPDRVGQRRADGARWLLRNGRGAALEGAQALAASPWIVAAELDGQGRESRVHLAAPIDADEVRDLFAEQATVEERVAWDDGAERVRAVRTERLGAIVLREAALLHVSDEQAAAALADAIRRRGLALLPWSRDAERLLLRLRFVGAHDEAWPDCSDDALLRELDTWLGPHLHGLRRLDDVRRVNLHDALLSRLAWPQRARLDELAPSHWTVPTGSRIPIDYADPAAPTAAVRLQELFGLAETPRVGGGRVPLVLQLLSPAHRPVQVTRDLAGFWRSSYFDVRRDLRGRYPRHVWPDDPLAAAPTRRAKRPGE